jgi:hypothetical protein
LILAGLVRLRAVGGLAPDHRTRGRQADRCLGIDGARNLRQATNGRVLARRSDRLLGRSLIDVGEAHPLHGIEVVQVAPIFLEPVCRGERLGVVSEMVFAELACRVTEIEQVLLNRRQRPSPWSPMHLAAKSLYSWFPPLAKTVHTSDEELCQSCDNEALTIKFAS